MQVLLATRNASLGNLIRRSLQRFPYEWLEVDNGFDLFQKAITQKCKLILLEYDLPRMQAIEVLKRFQTVDNFQQPPTIVLTQGEWQRSQIETGHFQRTDVVPLPLAIRKFVGTVQEVLDQETRVACLGGGTGLFTLLSGLKSIPGLHLTSIVSMSDDGGSTGKLRDMFGILPPGDVRRSLVALSTAPDLLNELIQYRFPAGEGLKDHNLGNLLLTALAQMKGSMSYAVKAIGEILNTQGDVIPVTEMENTLKAELEDGSVIEGEHRIDLFEGYDTSSRIKRLWQEPTVEATPDALQAILNARFILLGPGDLFTSIASNLIVSGVAEAICASSAKKIYICNIMTKQGETTNFDTRDHVYQIVKYLGKDVLDYVVCCSTRFSKKSIELYLKQGQTQVSASDPVKMAEITRAKVITQDVASDQELVRHDSLKLAGVIKSIFEGEKTASG